MCRNPLSFLHSHACISFITLSKKQTFLAESLKSRYNANEFDKIIQLVEECLLKDTGGNFLTENEKSDIVHDILVFLAEEMITMNKRKNEEIKGFFEWLERGIWSKIEVLTNKTIQSSTTISILTVF